MVRQVSGIGSVDDEESHSRDLTSGPLASTGGSKATGAPEGDLDAPVTGHVLGSLLNEIVRLSSYLAAIKGGASDTAQQLVSQMAQLMGAVEELTSGKKPDGSALTNTDYENMWNQLNTMISQPGTGLQAELGGIKTDPGLNRYLANLITPLTNVIGDLTTILNTPPQTYSLISTIQTDLTDVFNDLSNWNNPWDMQAKAQDIHAKMELLRQMSPPPACLPALERQWSSLKGLENAWQNPGYSSNTNSNTSFYEVMVKPQAGTWSPSHWLNMMHTDADQGFKSVHTDHWWAIHHHGQTASDQTSQNSWNWLVKELSPGSADNQLVQNDLITQAGLLSVGGGNWQALQQISAICQNYNLGNPTAGNPPPSSCPTAWNAFVTLVGGAYKDTNDMAHSGDVNVLITNAGQLNTTMGLDLQKFMQEIVMLSQKAQDTINQDRQTLSAMQNRLKG